jgi:inner membrane protein
MDPITHALAGTVVASFSGNSLSLSDPIYLGSILGSVAPDLDIIFQLKGDMSYLKHHRGVSHSIPGLLLFSLFISGILFFLFPGTAFSKTLFWTFAGAFSHSFLDVLNSYGVKLLWPLYNKKVSVGILTIFDPLLLFFILASVVAGLFSYFALFITVSCLLLYLMFRYFMRLEAKKVLKKKYKNCIERIIVIPSMFSIWSWHYLIESKKNFTVGEIQFLSWKDNIKKCLKKQNHPAIKSALKSKLGLLFKDFTPIFHVFCSKNKSGLEVEFVDLRYLLKNEFMHSATCLFNNNNQLVKGLFHPYSKNNSINVVDPTGQ